MAIDLVTTGGLVTMPLLIATGKVGVAAAAATGSPHRWRIGELGRKNELAKVLGKSEEAFREQRSSELRQHGGGLRKEVFRDWESLLKEWRSIEMGPLAQWEKAVEELKSITRPGATGQ